MDTEMKMIEKNNTKILIDRPDDQHFIRVKIKLNPDEPINKYKARLAIKGYAQLDGYVKKRAESKVCKVIKAFYGLKQAPRAWYERIDEHFKD
ncbi:Reverse transcriptase [Theobroma cacao]|nr:Reverse transcriptase [Theobroma cacao]